MTSYVELRAASAFSFLDGASLPEDLILQAAALGLSAVALVDTNGVYGAPRFYKAARAAGVRPLVGAEIVVDASRLTVLVGSRTGYKNLCRLLTIAAAGKPKGAARVTWDQVAAHAEGLFCLSGGDEGPLAAAFHESPEAARWIVERLAGIFPGRFYLEIQRHHQRHEERRNQAVFELAQRCQLPVVATNGVRYARRHDKDLFDVLACIRRHTNLDAAGRIVAAHRERHLKSSPEMAALFADQPRAIAATVELAEKLNFTLADLGYRFPDYPLPPGETADSFLRKITDAGARDRFRPLTDRARAQIDHELAVIAKLGLAGYFLIVWDIVQFCRREGILAQGRGSAANSAVCYALSITAVDPVKMELLFERFLSKERGEWPDIDLDLPSGERRERVIQYVYQRYGPSGAGMTANVITYRDRSAAREVGKALGYSLEQIDRLSKHLSGIDFEGVEAMRAALPREVAAAGLDPREARARHFMGLWIAIQGLPRHLGQHSGGIVIAAGRLDEVVPLEPAAMDGRVVIQWDKDDCADLGIIKVDLLGLGMLAALEEVIPMIRTHEGVSVDLAHLPADDPAVYRMLNAADTVGLFQVESRAQMSSLPRNAPRTFYDLVVQVAIIRPGPITGGMLKSFYARRAGREAVSYPDPCLEPILKRTLGVPIFQEQLLRIAMVAAGFTGGEAEELRRAMGFKRSAERMEKIEEKLRKGMAAQGLSRAAQETVAKSIRSFAMYGFPESHAASFALIAYASAYLKAHHPAAFYAAILNAWPMGFYHPATLVKDAQRRGVAVHPIDVMRSGWDCRWEAGGVRIGLRYVKGLREGAGRAIEVEQTRSPFRDAGDWARRCGLRSDELDGLAEVGALAAFGLTRRAALWQVAKIRRPAGPLYNDLACDDPSPLGEMSAEEETVADYRTAEITTGPHLMAHHRGRLSRDGILSAAALREWTNGARVRTAGLVIVRQRPATAKGFVFLTLEDETGMIQAIIRPDLFRAQRAVIVSNPALVVEGVLQQEPGAAPSVRAERFHPHPLAAALPSHDFS